MTTAMPGAWGAHENRGPWDVVGQWRGRRDDRHAPHSGGHSRGRWAQHEGRDERSGHEQRGPERGPEAGGPEARGRRRGRDRADGPFGDRRPFGPEGPFGPGGPFTPGFPFKGPRFGGPAGGRHGGRGGRGGRARRGDVRLAALLLIAEEPRNGYQIIQVLEERTSGAWRPSPGAIYPALAQLEDEGLIRATEVDGRKAFEITKEGAAEVDALGDRPRPWESPDAAPTDTHEAVRRMWESFGQVAMATKAVGQLGDEHLDRAAADILDDTRTALYRLLAEGSGTGGQGDVGPQDARPRQ